MCVHAKLIYTNIIIDFVIHEGIWIEWNLYAFFVRWHYPGNDNSLTKNSSPKIVVSIAANDDDEQTKDV